jgi:CPA1 family monovalent cation:H+ antiporter
MIVFQITVIIFLAAILGTALSRRYRLPRELTLLIGSLGIALIPGVPSIHIDSDIIFFVILPPILFAAAYFTSWSEFKRNIRPISLLAFGLVIFTVCGMAVVIKWLIPTFTWPMAFLFGAIVSPPDASAAATVTRKTGFPRRLQTILEGESLVNDATALVCYRFALAALISRQFHLVDSVGQFFLVGLGGIAVGLAISYLMLRLLFYIQDSSAEALLTLLTAFVCYFAAESIHLSGVIATVAGGLYAGRKLPRVATPETRVEAKALWNVALLAVNALIFTLIGLELPTIIEELGDRPKTQLWLWAVFLTIAVIAIRFIWVFPATWLPRFLIPGLAKRDPMPPVGAMVVIAWTGMRGIVSLAAALAIPETLAGGSVFVERPLLIFLAYTVILLTLIVPTVTLPALIRFLKPEDSTERQDDQVKARLAMAQAATNHISELRAKEKYKEEILSDVNRRYQRQIDRLTPNLASNAYSSLDPTEQQRRALLLELFDSERSILHELRSSGDLYDEVYHQLGDELDLETLRVRRNMRPI